MKKRVLAFLTALCTIISAFGCIIPAYAESAVSLTVETCIEDGKIVEDTVTVAAGDTYTVPETAYGYTVLRAVADGVTYEPLDKITFADTAATVKLYITEDSFHAPGDYATYPDDKIYEITTAEEWWAMANAVDAGYEYDDKIIIVTEDLDFTAYPRWVTSLNTSPAGEIKQPFSNGNVGAGSYAFKAHLNGLYHHFKIETTQSQALFAYIEGAIIENIVFDKGNMVNTGKSGVLAFLARNSTIRNIENHISVSCSTAGSTAAHNHAIVCMARNTTFRAIVNYGEMGLSATGGQQQNAGVLAHGYDSCNLSDCYNAGKINGTSSGNIARSGGTITNYYYTKSDDTGTIKKADFAAPKTAYALNTLHGTVKNSGIWTYSEDGPVIDPANATYVMKGTMIDKYNNELGTIDAFYNYGQKVEFSDIEGYTFNKAVFGHIVLGEDGTMPASDCDGITVYYDNNTYSINYVLGGGSFVSTPVTTHTSGIEQLLPTADMLSRDGYGFKGWYDNSAFEGEKILSVPADQYESVTYYAKWGEVTEISTAAQLAAISDLDGSYILTADIDMSGVEFTAIGSMLTPFTGSFDGNGYVISNLKIEGDKSYQGLFGYSFGNISNVTLDSTCSISGSTYVGGIAGFNGGSIVNCISNAKVTATQTETTDYRIMSQNLCMWGEGNFSVATRQPLMINRITANDPDVIAFQEGTSDWISYLENNLKGYEILYKYRSTTSLESVPVAYKTDKFNLIESGHFWLSETPDVESIGWDASLPRICTYVVLQDKTNGEMISLFNVHLDQAGTNARKNGSALIHSRMKELIAKYASIMIFAAGDFNSSETSSYYKAFSADPMADVRYIADVTSDLNTYCSDTTESWTTATSSRLDYMLTYNPSVDVSEFKVLAECVNGTRLSDHNGLFATFNATKNTAFGGVTGLNNGVMLRCVSDADVDAATEAGGIIGRNNGITGDLYHTGKAAAVGNGEDDGCTVCTEYTAELVWNINERAGAKVLTVDNKNIKVVGGLDTAVPVRALVNNVAKYAMSGETLTLDTEGFTNPVCVVDGTIIKDNSITLTKNDCYIVIREWTGETEEFIIGNVRIQPLSDTVVRIELKGENGFEDRLTYHIVNRDFDGTYATMVEGDTVTQIVTDSYTVTVPNDALSLEGISIVKDDKTVWEYTTLPDASNFLPDPANTPDAYEIADNPRVVPSEWGYSVMPEGEVDENDRNGWDTSNDAPDMYIFLPDGDAKQLRSDFNALTGSTELVPLKALGLWYSRYYAYSASTAIEQIQKFREEGFPLDYFVVDTDWKESASTGYDINTELYPDMEGFINKAQTEEHVNIVFNDHPVAYENSNPLAATEVEYRNTNLRKYLNMGINAWWYDRNWPNSIASPVSGITSDSFGMYLYHNITQSERPESRPMILANVDGIDNGPLVSAPNLASHRYSIQWTDDIKNTPDYLKQEIENQVILGATAAIPYVSSDVGGHSGVNSPVLYTRWTQYAAFSSVFRFHSSNQDIWDRAPWLYGEDAENTTRNYVKMRYNLLPLYYSLAHENYESGMPIVRRLDFNYPAYAQSQDNTQYTLGDNILVAPIWEDGDEFTAAASRQVFIPDGRWIDVWTGTEYVGPQTITVSHTANTSPLFVRSGTVLALADNDIDYIEEGSWQNITLDVYPSTKLEGSTVLYEDDETSVGYKNGEYRTTDITTSYDGEAVVNIGKANGTFTGSDDFTSRNWTVRVHAPESFGAVTGITLNGETVSATKIEKVTTGAMPFATSGAALDADVYEVTFTAALDSESELRVGFETPQDEQLPEYSTIEADTEIEAELSPDSVSLTESDDWVYFGSDANARKDTENGIIKNITVDGEATYTDGLVNANWTDGDTIAVGNTSKALSVDGSVSFDVAVDENTKYITLYVGGQNAAGRVSVWDGTNSGVTFTDVSNLYGKFAKKVVIEASAEQATNIHITYTKTDGDGAVSLLAATVDNEANAPVAVEYTTELTAIPTSVDFTNDSTVLDYVHLGAGGNFKSINRKNNVNSLVGDPYSVNAFGLVSDYASPFTYSDATPTATVSSSKNAIYSYDTIEFDVRSTEQLRELKVYVGAYQSTLTMEVFDDAGSIVSKQTLTATSTQRRILSVKFKSEKDSTLHVRLSCSDQTTSTGNIALAAYSVSLVKEISTDAKLSVTASPATADKTVNFDADGVLDYVHLGYNGSSYAAGAVSQKANTTLLSAPTFSNTCGPVGDSGFKFTYTNAESNKTSDPLSANNVVYANNAGSGNSNKDYIEFSAESDTVLRELTVYFGAYRASAQIDVFDSERNVIATSTLAGSASTNYQSIFKVRYSSSEPSVIYVRITEAADFHATAGNGNVSLAGYSVKEATEVYSQLGYKDATSVNLEDASIYDYVHLGWAGATNTSSATSQNRKNLAENEQILSNVTGTYKATYNSQPTFNFGSVTGANTSFYVDTIGNSMQYDVKATDEWQRLVMYVSAWNSDASIEVQDASGAVIDTKTIAYANRNDGNNNRGKYTLDFKSANSETLTVKVTLLTQYNGGNVGVTAYYITDPLVSEIAVSKAPTKTVYYEGDSFDATGMELEVTYDTGAVGTVISGFETSADLSSVGDATVTVTYQGKTANCTVNVTHELYTVSAKQNDCTTDGYSEHSACKRCDHTENKAVYKATGHTTVKVDGKDATPTENGYKEHYMCEICKEYFEDAEATKAIADIEAWKTGDGIVYYRVAENIVTGESYFTLDDALENANEGDTIKLCDDITTSYVIVTSNITLDINGHSLTAKYVTGFDMSNIIDSNVTQTSGIYVDKTHLEVSENNAQLPIYDAKNGCYMFTDVVLEYTHYENSSYYFGPEMAAPDTVEGARVNALLRENSADTGVNIIVHLDWETDDYFSTQDFTYKPSYVEQYFTMANTDGHYYNVYFYARFMGDVLKQADSVTVTTIVKSDRGTQFKSESTTFSMKD